FLIQNNENMALCRYLVERYKEIKNDVNLKEHLQTIYDKNIAKLDELLKSNVLQDIQTLIDSLQKQTMVSNFEQFLTGKLEYIEKLFESYKGDSFAIELIKLQMKKYKQILEILYDNGFPNLYKKLQRLSVYFLV